MKDIEIKDLSNAFPIIISKIDGTCLSSEAIYYKENLGGCNDYDFNEDFFYLLDGFMDIMDDDNDDYYEIVHNDLYTDDEIQEKLDELREDWVSEWTYKNGNVCESKLEKFCKRHGIKLLRSFETDQHSFIVANEKLTDEEWEKVKEEVSEARDSFVAGYFKKKSERGTSVIKLIKEYQDI